MQEGVLPIPFPQQSKLMPIVLKTLGIFFTVFAIVCFFAAFVAGRSGSGYGILLSIIIGGLSGLLAAFSSAAYMRSRQHTAISADIKLTQDKRAPVLYLRPFSDEALDRKHEEKKLAFLPSLSTQEEQLVKILDNIGPTIAIGKPNEPLPELGAARLYVEESRWRDSVLELLGKACLVVIRAGDSKGLLWEEQQVIQRMRPEQVVFILPDDAQLYQSLRARLNPHLANKLPQFEEWEESDRSILRAILYFQPGWKPKMVDLAQVDAPFKKIARVCFQPIIDQLKKASER